MSHYLFYTSEGYTQAPDNQKIENCQVLGCAHGDNAEDALQNLLAENPWIEKHQYSKEAIVSCQIVDK